MKTHKHAEWIKAKADGNIIQKRVPGWPWEEMPEDDFTFHEGGEYRIKPAEPEKPCRKYPPSSMDQDDFDELINDAGQLFMIDIANAAIRRAIDDGQVVIAEDRDGRDMLIAETVAKFLHMPHQHSFLKDIIAGVK